MPDPYVNPTRKPFVGSYKWLPPSIGIGGANSLNGFKALIIDRGKFINYQAPYNNSDPKITAQSHDTQGNVYSPVLNSFRPLQSQNIHLPPASSEYLQMGYNFAYTCDFNTPMKFSGVNIVYDFSIWLGDTAIETYYNYNGMSQSEIDDFLLKLSDARKILNQSSSVTVDLSFINTQRLMLGQALAKDLPDKIFEFPNLINGLPVSFPITRVRTNREEVYLSTGSFNDYFIKTVHDQTNVNNFSLLKQISLKQRPSVSSNTIVFRLKNIRFYQAERVNFYRNDPGYVVAGVNTDTVDTSNNLLPAQAMSYSFKIFGKYDGGVGGYWWPQSGDHISPNLFVKVFNPSYITKSPGFAHALSIYVFIVSWNFYDPLANFFGFSGPLYNGIIIGLKIAVRKNTFYLNPKLATNSQGQIRNTTGRSAMLLEPFINNLPNNISSLQGYYFDDSSNSNFPYVKFGNSILVGNTLPSNKYESLISGKYITKNGLKQVDDNIQFKTIYTTKEGGIVSNDLLYGPEFENYQPMQALVDTNFRLSVSNSKQIYRYFDSITKETINNLLNLNPIALFLQESDRPFANPINIENGVWTITLNLSAIDSLELFDSRIFFRFWFVPEEFDFSTDLKIKNWLNNNEFYFDSQYSGLDPQTDVTVIKKGKPTTIDNLFISGPLPNNEQEYQFSKYINEGLSFSFNTIDNQRLRLVIGLYGYSLKKYPPLLGQEKSFTNATHSPILSLKTSPNSSIVSTTITQELSDAEILPYRDFSFVDVQQFKYSNNLKVLNYLVSGEKFDSSYQAPYKQNIDNSDISKLLVIGELSSGHQACKFIIPLDDVSDFRNTTTSQYVDFITYSFGLYGAKVDSGSWKISVKTNYPDIEKTNIVYEIRLDCFLINSEKSIVTRIFRTEFKPSVSGEYLYDIDITAPFFVPQTYCQLLLRITYIGYSRKFIAVDINQINDVIAPLTVGLKVQEITISSNTLKKVIINQSSTSGNSPSFYEDLPLTGDLLDDPSFIFILDPDILKPQVIFGSDGLLISGALYSPSYLLDLPLNMEVNVKSALLGDTLGVRTAKTQKIQALSSAQDKNFQTLVAYNGVSTNSATPNPIELVYSDSSQRIDKKFESATGLTASGNKILQGTNPIVLPYNSYTLGYQGDLPGGSNYNIQQGSPNYNQFLSASYPTYQSFVSNLESYLINTINVNAFYDKNFDTMYVCGITSNNFLIYKAFQITDKTIYPTVSNGNIFVIDGPPSGSLTSQFGENFIYPNTSSSRGLIGALDGKFCSIVVDKNKSVFCAYVRSNDTKTIYLRSNNSGFIGTPIPIISIKALFGNNSVLDNFYLSNPCLVYNNNTNQLGVIFWMGVNGLGKIFYSVVDINAYNSWSLVAGNYLSTDDKNMNDFNLILKNSSKVYLPDNYEEDSSIPEQKPGVFIDYERSADIHNTYVQYYVNSASIRERIVLTNGLASAKYRVIK